MAVYTDVSETQLKTFLQRFNLGELLHFQGIAGGIENSNYFVTTEKEGRQQQSVLTLFEELNQDELTFFVQLGLWLHQRRVVVPYAIADKMGNHLHHLCGKPAMLQPRFSGQHIEREELTEQHCRAIGTALARFHIAARSFPLTRQAHRGVFWWRSESRRIAHQLPPETSELLLEEVYAFDQLREADHQLPSGIIHGDLFRDNALFNKEQLTAILDIYNAASGFLLYDLAVVANDWCTLDDGTVNPSLEQALLQGYSQVRPFTQSERSAWPILSRTAAMRFWLSRLIPLLAAKEAQRNTEHLKDPEEFKRILEQRKLSPSQLP